MVRAFRLARPELLSWLCRRALDLVYALVNENNIQSLTKELLDYLQVADAEFKPDLTAKIAALVQRFAPDKRWHFDSLLQVPVGMQTCCDSLSLTMQTTLLYMQSGQSG